MIEGPARNRIAGTTRTAAVRIPAALSCLMAAMGGGALAQAATLDGTATFRERIALPPDAVFEAVLQAVPRAGTLPATLGKALLDPAGQPPLRFRIEYDESAVQPGTDYAVTAAVTQRGTTLFATRGRYRVLTGASAPLQVMLVASRAAPRAEFFAHLPASYEREAPGASNLVRWHLDLLPLGGYQLRTTHLVTPPADPVDQLGRWQYDSGRRRLRLEQAGRPARYFAVDDEGAALRPVDTDGAPPGVAGEPLRRLPQPALIEPRLALAGMFIYVADAASITLCDDGRRLPVAVEADYRSLEATYARARPAAGTSLYVRVDASIVARPSQEDGQPARPTLVVHRVLGTEPGESCGSMLVRIPLRGTQWKLVQLDGNAVIADGGRTPPHLVFATDSDRVAGSGGCNRVTGSFSLHGDELRFGQMAGTMMACAAATMTRERLFLQALPKVERQRVRGGHLDLLDASGATLARFAADVPGL